MGVFTFRHGRNCRYARVSLCIESAVVGLLAGCAHTDSLSFREPARETAAEAAAPTPRAEAQIGYATWYGAALAGHRTASGERFDPSKMTAAHRTLPFGTWVDVVRLDNGRSVRVRITDRGPFGHDERIIDLARVAAKELGILKMGLVRVKLVVLASRPEAPF